MVRSVLTSQWQHHLHRKQGWVNAKEDEARFKEIQDVLEEELVKF